MGLFLIVSAVFLSAGAQAKPAKILFQFEKALVRLNASDRGVVAQEVDQALHFYDFETKKGGSISLPRKPLVADVSGPLGIFGLGRPWDGGVEVHLFDFRTSKTTLLDRGIPWVVESGISVTTASNGAQRIRAVWEHAKDFLKEEGVSVQFYEKIGDQPALQRTLAEGPIETVNETPPSAADAIKNHFPKIDGDRVVFVSTEHGLPQVYLHDLNTGKSKALSRSEYFQERPSIRGRYVAWQESELGFWNSTTSWTVVYDLYKGTATRVSPEDAFDVWPKVSANYVAYTAKREPHPKLLSIRVYDPQKGVEYPAQFCFPGKITDFGVTQTGVVAAQNVGSTTRLLFATWEQIAAECR